MRKYKFKVGDIVKNKYQADIWEVDYIDYNEGTSYPYFLKNNKGDALWSGEEELTLIKETESHKGCEFINNDFYRSFTNKNGSVVFNKVKVSTLCTCKYNEKLCFATINSDKRLKAGTKVKLNNKADVTVVSCIKVMDKYIDDFVKGMSDAFDTKIYKVIGIYEEKEVTKTELVLEEI